MGLRNARLNFRQQEEYHIMENVIYNELMARKFDIDIGIVEYNTKDENGKKVRSQLEIDFVANKGSKRFSLKRAVPFIKSSVEFRCFPYRIKNPQTKSACGFFIYNF